MENFIAKLGSCFSKRRDKASMDSKKQRHADIDTVEGVEVVDLKRRAVKASKVAVSTTVHSAASKEGTKSGDQIQLESFRQESLVESLVESPDLIIAQNALYDALQKLEAVLQKTGPLEKFQLQLREIPGVDRKLWHVSFTTLAKELESQHSDSQKSVSSQVERFIDAIYPMARLALGLTGTVASSLTFSPLEVTANGLGRILDVSSHSCAFRSM